MLVMRGLNRLLVCALVVLAIAQDAASSDANERAVGLEKNSWAVVANPQNTGAFVLPAGGPGKRDKVRIYLRVGYVGHGTLVRVIGQCRRIPAKKASSRGIYCHVRSEQGVEGFIKMSLLFPLQRGKTYAIPVKTSLEEDRSDPLYLFQVHEPRSERRNATFNRRIGTLIEIIGDWKAARNEDFVPVRKTWDGGRQTVKKIDLISRMEVLETPSSWVTPIWRHELRWDDEADDWRFSGATVRAGVFEPVTERTQSRLYRRVKAAFSNNLSGFETPSLLKKLYDTSSNVLDRLACSASAHAEASVGWNLFGNGAKIGAKLQVLQPGMTLGLDTDVVSLGPRASFNFASIKTIVCSKGAGFVDSLPKSVSAVEILLAQGMPKFPGAVIPTESVKNFGLEPAVAAVDGADGSGPSVRMFTIKNHGDHAKALRMIRTYLEKRSSMWDDLSTEQQSILLEALVKKLGDFERQG